MAHRFATSAPSLAKIEAGGEVVSFPEKPSFSEVTLFPFNNLMENPCSQHFARTIMDAKPDK
jgi:hypothetical protein